MIIAGRACADAANDGYTICLLPNETLTLNQEVGGSNHQAVAAGSIA
jgi:hypothetical protein